MNIVIETDIGHDSDDLQVLATLLKLVNDGNVNLLYVSCVSGNNNARAHLANWLIDCVGMNVPVFSTPILTEWKGRKVDLCTMINEYHHDSDINAYVHRGEKVYDDSRILQDAELKKKILQQHRNVRVMIIGPGVDYSPYMSAIASVHSVYYQGVYNDRSSFNIGADWESYQSATRFFQDKSIPQYYVGRNIAYQTRLTQKMIHDLCERCTRVDLHAIFQLGIAIYRDLDRNMFNQVNFSVSSPGESIIQTLSPVILEKLEAFSESNDKHVELYDALTCSSLSSLWFDSLPALTPMYDITCFHLLYFLKDDNTHPFYSVESIGDHIFTVKCITQPHIEYMEFIFNFYKDVCDFL
ncbi:hypothetical protein PCE1_003860 [Barthelona sp. PCE]